MQTEGQKTVTIIEVSFSEEEWAMLERRTDVGNTPAQYIHDVVMRSLRRKAKKESSNG